MIFLDVQNIDEKTINDIIDKLAHKNSFGFDRVFTKLIKTTKAILINCPC